MYVCMYVYVFVYICIYTNVPDGAFLCPQSLAVINIDVTFVFIHTHWRRALLMIPVFGSYTYIYI